MRNENTTAAAAFKAAVDSKNKAEATKQRELLAKNCGSLSKLGTLKCKIGGEEIEYKGSSLKDECTKAINDYDLAIKGLN